MKVMANALWLSCCRIAADGLSFVLFLAIARTLGPTGTGQYSYAFAIAGLVALVSTSGLEEYGIRQYARAAPGERAQLWASMLVTQGVQLALGLTAFALFLGLETTRLAGVVVMLELAAYVVGWGIARTLFVPAMASQSMAAPAASELICRLAAIAFALVLARRPSPSLPWMLAGFPVAGAVLVALAARNAAGHVSLRTLRWNGREIATTVRGSWPFAAADVLNQFYARADVLLIAYLLGSAQVGLYATGIKFVEIGLLPLVLLGTAAYPLLSKAAVESPSVFAPPARELVQLILFLGGWLATALYCLVPVLIVPLFGERFAPAALLLPLIALFAAFKGAEVAFYRVLYSLQRQTLYVVSLVAGSALIVTLNLMLIPSLGLNGAVIAAIVSTAAVDAICAFGLARPVGLRFLASSLVRTAIALAMTAAAVEAIRRTAAGPWVVALTGCLLFPLLGIAAGLVRPPRRSDLLRRTQTPQDAGIRERAPSLTAAEQPPHL
jgi:PST family polysaccharide transporter